MEDLPKKVAKLEARIDEITSAHLALAAQNTALVQFIFGLLPVLHYNRKAVLESLTEVFDDHNQSVESEGLFDERYAKDIRHHFDVLVRLATLPPKSERG